MKALVTGGGGFLGKAIIERLLQRGDDVRSFSRGDYAELRERGVEVVRGNLDDANAVADAASGCDLIFHVAAKAGIGGRYRDYYQTNVVGSQNILAACRKNNVRRLVCTSSPSVVFDGKDMEGVDEAVPYPARYDAHYPRTKAAAEQLVLQANDDALATVALRPHLIWGPGDNHLIPRILTKAKAGRLRRIGGANKLIDTTYIDNAADAHVLAADKLSPESPVAGKAYFISNGEPIPLWDMINRILETAELPPVTKRVPFWLAVTAGWILENSCSLLRPDLEPPMSRFLAHELSTAHWFDISAARRDLGYEPNVSIDEGLQKLASHHKKAIGIASFK